MVKHSRLNLKGLSVEFKDDDYETPEIILNDLLPYLEPNKIIYDPFYCRGTIIKEWAKVVGLILCGFVIK